MEIISSILFFVEKKRHISIVVYGFFLGMLPQQWPFPDDMKHSFQRLPGSMLKHVSLAGVSHLKLWSPATLWYIVPFSPPPKATFVYVFVYIHVYIYIFVYLYKCIYLLHTEILHKWLRHSLPNLATHSLSVTHMFHYQDPIYKTRCLTDMFAACSCGCWTLHSDSRCYEVNPSNLTPVFKLDLDIDEVSFTSSSPQGGTGQCTGQLMWP